MPLIFDVPHEERDIVAGVRRVRVNYGVVRKRTGAVSPASTSYWAKNTLVSPEVLSVALEKTQ
jgi:hypothetical protein